MCHADQTSNKIATECHLWTIEPEGYNVSFATCVDEAVDDWLAESEGRGLAVYPEFLTVSGWTPLELRIQPLSEVLDDLDIEFGMEDTSTQATERMRSAYHAFSLVMYEEYKVHQVQQVTSVEVDLRAWVKENDAELLEKLKFEASAK